MNARDMLTQNYLKTLIHYNPETGECVRLSKTSFNTKAGEVINGKDDRGYKRLMINRVRYKLHQLIWLYVYGEFPKEDIDHINQDKTDNRLQNLRDVSRSVNCRNIRFRKNSPFGISGISLNDSKYMVRIVQKGKEKYIGRFDDFFEACCVRKSAEHKCQYHSAT